MRTVNDTLISAPVDLSISWASNAIYLGHISNYSIQLFWTGAPEGSLKLQASDDAGQPNAQTTAQQAVGVTHWTDVTGSTQLVDEAGNHTWQVENAGYSFVRVYWAPTSGTGSITSARFNLKGV